MAADDAASDDASVLTATKPAPAKSPPFNVSSMATPALPTPKIFTAGALAGSSIAAGVWGLVFMMNRVYERRKKLLRAPLIPCARDGLPSRLLVLNEPNLTRPMALTNRSEER